MKTTHTNARTADPHVDSLASAALPPRPWLDAHYTTTRLLIWDTQRTRVSQAVSLNLDVYLPDGTNLQEPINAELLQLVLSYTYLLRDDKTLSIGTAHVHVDVVKRLLIFIKWARLQGIFSLRRVTPDLVEKFSAEISLGTGHALKYVERLTEYFRAAGNDLPLVTDKYYSKRQSLDVHAICRATFIPMQGLSNDVSVMPRPH